MEKEKSISSKKIINATKWSVITEVATKFITPIVNIILARILLPEAFGAVATISMIISLADIFTDSGFQKYIIQHEFKDAEEYEKCVSVAFWANLSLSAIIVLLIFIFRKNLSSAIGAPELSVGIAVSAIAIIFTSFSGIHLATYRRVLEFRTVFYLRIVSALIPFFVTIPLALLFRSYWALVIGTLVNDFFQAIVLSLHPKVKIRFFFSTKLFKSMFSFAGFTLLETLSIWLTTNVDIFLVGRLFDTYTLGLYKTSMQTVNSYMNIFAGTCSTVLFASLSRYQNDIVGYKNIFNRFQKLFSIVCIPMGVGILVFRDLVTRVLLGNNWIEASGFIGLWGFVSSFSVIICYFASEVFRSKGKPIISFYYQMIHVVTLIPVVLIASNRGFVTLYIARCIAVSELVISALIIMHFIFGMRILDVVRNIYIQVIASLIMGGVGNCMKTISSSFGWQIFCVMICILVYFIIILLTPLRKDIVSVIKNRGID